MDLTKDQFKKITELIQLWFKDPTFELETTFGPKGTVDSNTFLQIAQRLRTKEFEVIPHNGFADVETIIKSNNIDLLYIIKSGANDGKVSKHIKTCVHAVFPTNVNESHGNVYAYVSKWLSQFCSNGNIPYVPHMVNLPAVKNNFRQNI